MRPWAIGPGTPRITSQSTELRPDPRDFAALAEFGRRIVEQGRGRQGGQCNPDPADPFAAIRSVRHPSIYKTGGTPVFQWS